MKKKMVVLMAVLVLALSACSGGAVEFTDNAYAAELAAATTEEASTAVSVVQTASDTGTSASTEEAAETAVAPVSGEYDSDDLEPSVAGADTTYVVLAGDTITLDGEGATVDGSVVTITSAGTYSVSGTLDDGQITVDTDDEETVYLILDGVEIACSTSAPIYVSNAEKTVITLADGSENSVTDGDSYVLDPESDEPNAAVFSKDDLTINGGYLYVNAGGDGLDSNGSIEMIGGTVIVNGPTNDGNGPLDYLGTFNISGGLLVAVGSSGMAQAPSATSSQYSVLYNSSAQAAGTVVHIESESGQELLTFVPAKQYESVVFSSPELEGGSTYVLYSGGSSSGTVTDGLYSGETYSGGSQVASLSITGMVTTAGSAAGGFGGRTKGSRP